MKSRPADAESHHTLTTPRPIQAHETSVIVTIFILDVVSQLLSFY